ncbi:MAG: aminotransferase class III-fold pyridoxal phosphate-dependent enzyme [Caulobacterales bacterium]|nr:aminotransferase class III-fold pyridoxal phosphate-dependent enzyme [Caulobacterales bacterium]
MTQSDDIIDGVRSEAASDGWRARAGRVLAGKQSNFRPGPSRPPVIADRAEGARIWDVDGKDYVDFVLGMGPAIWGHSNEELFTAVEAQMRRLFSAGSAVMHTTLEIALAERIVEHVPCAERVRFGISGSEADQLAMRLARGATGRPYVVRFEGHYHGWLDTVFGGALADGGRGGPFPVRTPAEGAGLAPHSLTDTMMARWNDADALEALLAAHGDTIAMVLMEAALCNNGCCQPLPGYLERVRAACDAHGVLLCFDEVITGFRMDIGGAQGAYGVTPDLAIFGKALAGGLPLSAVAGRDDVMAKLRDNTVLGGGTFNSFPLALASGLATMDMLARDAFAFYRRMDTVQEAVADGLRASARRHGFDLLVQGPRGMLFFAFLDRDVAHAPHELAGADARMALAFRARLEEEGVLVAGGSRLVITPVMTATEVDLALARIDRALARLAADQTI